MDLENCLQEKIDRETKASAILFSLAALLDGATTIYLAKKYGIQGEISAPLRFAMNTFGIEGSIIASKAVLLTGAFIGVQKNYAKIKEFFYLSGVPILAQASYNMHIILSNLR